MKTKGTRVSTIPRRSWTRSLTAVTVAGLVLTGLPLTAGASELPAPSLSRSASPDGALRVGESVDLELTARNGGSGTAFDPRVVECVSAGLVVSGISPAAAVTPAGCDGGGTRIDWELDDLAPGAATPLRYRAVPESVTVAGTMFATHGRISVLTAAHHRPSVESPVPQGITERSMESARSLTYGLPAVTQSSSPQNPNPGDDVTFTLQATVPPGVGMGNAVVRDLFPVGFDLDRLTTLEVTCVDGSGAACALHDTAGEHHINHQRLVTWNIGHLSPAVIDRVFTVVLSVPVTAETETLLRNRSGMQWSDNPSIVGRAGLRGGAVAATTIEVGGPTVPTTPVTTTPIATATATAPSTPAPTDIAPTGTPSQPSVLPTEQVSPSDTFASGGGSPSPSMPEGTAPEGAGPDVSSGSGAASTPSSTIGAAFGSAPDATGVAGTTGTHDVLALTGVDLGARAVLGLMLLLGGGVLAAVGIRSTRRPADHR